MSHCGAIALFCFAIGLVIGALGMAVAHYLDGDDDT